MKLLEFNEIKEIFSDNYSISVGYISPDSELNSKNLNDGIVATAALTIDKIKHVSSIPLWQLNSNHTKGSFYRNLNKIYVCLYAPSNISLYEPTGSSLSNIILDDNYVWRYICDVDQYLFEDYVTLNKSTFIERVKKGCASSCDIIVNSGHQITDFASLYSVGSYSSGTGLDYVVENDQNTLMISDVLIQNGGEGYTNSDYLVITDIQHLLSDNATVDVYVEDGKVKLSSFTNGQNYTYLDIIILGDGTGSVATYNTVAGVLTSVTVSEGSGYTWAKAIVVNSEKHLVVKLNIEPLNGYNADLFHHVGPNKYIIETEFNNISDEINFYALHRNKQIINGISKYVHFEYFYTMTSFVPLSTETVKTRIILG